jgi:protein SCO1
MAVWLAGCATEKKCCCCCGGGGEPKNSAARSSVGQPLGLAQDFQDDNGNNFSLASLRGRPVVISMFYASCQGICLVTRDDMKAVEASLPAAVRGRTAFVLVTLAPEIDSPTALKQYRADNGLSEKNWILLRGSANATAELATQLGIAYWRDGARLFRHTSELTVLDENGKTVLQQDGVHADLAETVQAVAGTLAKNF